MDYTRDWLKQNPEKFPIAWQLLPQAARAGLRGFYGFLRGAYAITDSVKISPERRRQQLLALEESLRFASADTLPGYAVAFAAMARAQPPLMSYARDLLSACVQDTLKPRYRDYGELQDYCHRAAHPVARIVLLLCGQKSADMKAADALSAAIQMLHHIQSCSDDYVNRGYVYLPLEWFSSARADVGMLASSQSTPALRNVLNRGLEKCETVLGEAAGLALTIRQYRMRLLVTWLWLLARALHRNLQLQDPLERQVGAGWGQGSWCFLQAVVRAI